MRVVVNQLAALGVKTGIGHYTVELLRCLRAQAGTHSIDSFPEGWLRRAREACTRLRPRLEGSNPHTESGAGRPVASTLRSRALACVRQLGRNLMARHFRAATSRRGYDLY